MLENLMEVLKKNYVLYGGDNESQNFANSFETFFKFLKKDKEEMVFNAVSVDDQKNYTIQISTKNALPSDIISAELKQDNDKIYEFDYKDPYDFLANYYVNDYTLKFYVNVVADDFGGRKMKVLQRNLKFSDNSSKLSICKGGQNYISIRYTEKTDDETSIEYFYGTDKQNGKFINYLNIKFKNGKSYHVKLTVDFLIANDVFITSIFRRENGKVYRVENLNETELVLKVFDSLQDITHLPLFVDYLLGQAEEKLANPESFPFVVYNMK